MGLNAKQGQAHSELSEGKPEQVMYEHFQPENISMRHASATEKVTRRRGGLRLMPS